MKSGEIYEVTIPGENGDITIKAVVIINCGNKVLFYGKNRLFTMLYSTLEFNLTYDEVNDFFVATEQLFFDEIIVEGVTIKDVDKCLI
jgi:hypothetical protein